MDEADLLFSFGYEENIRTLLPHLPPIYQATLLSATLSDVRMPVYSHQFVGQSSMVLASVSVWHVNADMWHVCVRQDTMYCVWLEAGRFEVPGHAQLYSSQHTVHLHYNMDCETIDLLSSLLCFT